MFTGIIETTTPVTRFQRRGSGGLLGIESPWAAPPKPGESISVNGACLTVASADRREILFDVSRETLDRTKTGQARPGTPVNVERALKLGDDVSGHFVAGHVDCIGEVKAFERGGDFARLAVGIPREYLVYLVPKGSIAVDGVSLTIASLEDDIFGVAVIPQTLKRTALGTLKPGGKVNIETDMLGKYVVGYLARRENRAAGPSGLTIDRLKRLGY